VKDRLGSKAEIQTKGRGGIPRSRRRKQAREWEALAARAAPSQAMRAEALAAALGRDLERCATIHAIMTRKLAARRGVGRRAPVLNPATIQ